MKYEAWFICSMADSGVLSDVWGIGISLHTLMTCMAMFVAPLQFLPLETLELPSTLPHSRGKVTATVSR